MSLLQANFIFEYTQLTISVKIITRKVIYIHFLSEIRCGLSLCLPVVVSKFLLHYLMFLKVWVLDIEQILKEEEPKVIYFESIQLGHHQSLIFVFLHWSNTPKPINIERQNIPWCVSHVLLIFKNVSPIMHQPIY